MSPPKSEDRRAIWSWCLFDFANSPFTTLVITFIYATYFANVMGADYYLAEGIAEDKEQAEALGTALWARSVTIGALVVAFLSPFMGALADRGGYRKAFLLASTAICVVGSASLYFITPDRVFLALGWVVVANVAFEMGMVFYNAFLPDIAPAEKIGRISGNGWGLGYAGGLLTLVLALITLVQPIGGVPWFGFSEAGGEHIRATNLLVAIWLAVFSLPLFLWVKEDKSQVTRAGNILSETLAQLRGTYSELRKYRQIVRFLVARLFYNDGLVTVFAFGGIYAYGTFQFTASQVLVFGIVLNITAGLGAIAMGYLDDRLGGKKSIQISLLGLTVGTTLGVLAPNAEVFWVAGVLIGIFSGPNQASSRSLMARFVPPDKENEFFGFFAFSGKATAFMGPALLGAIAYVSRSQRLGVAVVLVFFVAGLFLLSRVDEEEGVRAAGR